MIIRQDSFFSYDDLMEISPKTRLMMILDKIDVSPVATAMGKTPGTRGPKGYPEERLLYALIAKEVEHPVYYKHTTYLMMKWFSKNPSITFSMMVNG